MIHYTLDVLGSFIGPLFGILIADYYFVRRQQVLVDELYTMNSRGRLLVQARATTRAPSGTLIPSALVAHPVRHGARAAGRPPTTPGSSAWAWGFVIYLALNRKS